MRYRFLTCDVFTDRRFGGNQLAVLPDAEGLDTARMQRLAAEFNYSETTFVLPPRDPANLARVRIFTPRAEMPFAGHPTVGTALVLAWLGRTPPGGEFVLEEEAGPGAGARCGRRTGRRLARRVRRPAAPEPRAGADAGRPWPRALGLEPADLVTRRRPALRRLLRRAVPAGRARRAATLWPAPRSARLRRPAG